MKLVAITPPFDSKNETQIVNQLFELGLDYLHLRKPLHDHKALIKYLLKVDEEHRAKIKLHQHFEVSETHQVGGIHFKENHLKLFHQHDPEYIRWMQRKKEDSSFEISASFHDPDELMNCPDDFSYTFISPVFESISKTFYAAPFSMAALQRSVKLSPQNVMALGGIEPAKMELVKEMGFYGVAVLGYLWKDEHPIEAFNQILESCRVAESTS